MNLRRPRKPVPKGEEVLANVRRIEEIWRDCRAKYGKGGRFLFGRFCIADAMFAPVVTRLDTYDFDVAADTRSYMDSVLNSEAFGLWKEAALKEPWTVPSDEVD